MLWLTSVNMSEKDKFDNCEDQVQIKVYKRRWIILFIFFWYSAISAFQWIQYPIITNIVMRYYNVSALYVDWTSIVYMLLYAPLILPASYIVDKKGLRVAALIGGLGTGVATILKLLTVRPDYFWLVLVCQTILAASQTVILSIPPRLAAVWFGPEQVSTACALGVLGCQFGTAAGFILPPLMVRNHANVDDIGRDLYNLNWVLAGTMIPVAIAILVYFPKQPPLPPSPTQLAERNNKGKFNNTDFWKSLRKLFRNKPFWFHMTAYGINIACFSAMSTYMNQYILSYFENSEKDAGFMGLLGIVVGMAASIIFGIILDKTRKYKEMTLFVYGASCISTAAYMFSLELRSKLLVYVIVAVLGFFNNAYWSVGFEMSSELTYPVPESTATGILMAMTQILGAIFTLVTGWTFPWTGTFWSIAGHTSLLLVGTVITAFMPNKLRRQAAFNEDKKNIGFELVPTAEKNANSITA